MGLAPHSDASRSPTSRSTLAAAVMIQGAIRRCPWHSSSSHSAIGEPVHGLSQSLVAEDFGSLLRGEE